ncbi:TonB-dependent receptor [Shewanella sp. D64]|uniref:TonB-dependent receptor n=1 Tax=unclassified Shewanella TaxID=196818 RepID=UPI0022BA5EA6|nr:MULTISPECIES: TonB-dependent receptor [unclassified Shewanella]MEC4726017.1 TonB-dependent receptor [Shewanella sp. D64]MEC4737272.1 TonB-dependent receptor [Shewanella sp. E94]WBJ93649.1 TonB-dependent receptor [Shewanella sp. MTB7]
MYKNSFLANSVRFALISGAAAAAFAAPAIYAADEEKVERITVTGSAIKQTDMEGALPVQVITAEQIARSGVTNVPELIQQLPAMQGFTTAPDSVGGGGGGLQTASIHDLGASYTLVLLNGRRLAPSTSGSTIDLNSIPFAAIERVEILTDGASALYGSDAIAGVLNFILKDNYQGFNVTGRYDKPQETGGESWNGSITGGFGDIDNDGFNVLLSYSHDTQEQLASKDRDFAKTGIISFQNEGRDLYFFNGSGNAIPGNARVSYKDANGDTVRRAFNPFSQKNGGCAENTSAILEECWFDYTSTIEIVPEIERDTIFANGQLAINDDTTLFLEANFANTKMVSRIAPYPTGWFNLPVDAGLVDEYIVPYLNDAEKAAYDAGDLTTQARWRALPAGNRTTEYDTRTIHTVFGVEGLVGDVDYSVAGFYSSNDSDQNYPTGWLLEDPFKAAVSSGQIDIFAPADGFDDASQAALDKTIYSGNWSNTKTKMYGFDGKASTSLFSLPAGDVYMAAGFDWRSTSYDVSISQANQDAVILFLGTDTAYELERQNYGVFSEVQIPVIEDLNVTASVRYDKIDAIDDKLNGGTVGNSMDDITYKLSTRYQVTEDLLLRGSYGTGFKAPSMLGIARPQSEFGVTGGSYDCPFPSGDPLAQYCLSGKSQYSVFLKGNEELEPEKSEQYSFGLVYAPSQEFSLTLDYWNVEMKDQVASLTQSQIFEDAELYRELFTTKLNSGTGEEELAIIQGSVNVGNAKYSGIDWNAQVVNELSFGTLTTGFTGTYMIDSEYTKPGTDEYISSMGRFGDNESVTFRVISQLQATLDHSSPIGEFAHTVRANYKSGYKDQLQTVTENDAFGDPVSIQLNISSYTTFDYQTTLMATDELTVSFGITNFTDTKPDLSLRSGGAGHQVGYDPRYVDSYGRTFYLQAGYSF